ncbi:hypothetical protein BDC45DRAFT_541145 [Circinella umbellata]|nr:hypothetical protein BDC45DRAFT_541145 [Circinella umbellata]
MEGNFNHKKKRSTFRSKERSSRHNARRPKKVDSKHKNNSPSSLSSSINNCNDKDKKEDGNRQEGTKDIIATASQAAHYHNANNTVDDNNTTEKNINELGASPALDDVVLDDYRLCHNIDVGTMNRSDKIHKGHYRLRLTRHINDLRLQL